MYALLVLSLLVQFFNSFPTIAGDCYNGPLNNKSYDNCATCYQTLANALINTGDNKYQLGRSFFPADSVTPVEVRVEYVPESQCNTENISCDSDDTPHTKPCTSYAEDQPQNNTTRWYWLAGEFYAFQPLNLFLFRSLLFSPPTWRKECVVLCLPDECLSNISDDFLKYLTQRLMLYTTFQTVEARVDISYVGTAINGDCQSSIFERPLKGAIRHGIIAAGYIIPFAMVALILLIIILLLMYKKTWELLMWLLEKVRSMTCRNYAPLHNEPNGVPNALNGVPNAPNGILSPLRLFGRRMQSKFNKFLIKVKNDVGLQGNFAAMTLICCFATLYIFALDRHSIDIERRGGLPGYYLPKQNYFFYITIVCSGITFLPWILGLLFISFFIIFRPYKFSHVPMILCISSTVLALSFHFQTILIAWTITPFYAGRIFLYYGVIIFVYFLSLKYTYILSVELCDGKYNARFIVISLLFTTVVVSGVVTTVAIFVVYVPTINTIEEFAIGITTIYHGAVLFIGGLIAYNVGGHYLGGSFSVNTVLRSAMKKLTTNPFSPAEDWEVIPEETRMSKVVTDLIKREPFKGNDFYWELNTAETLVPREPEDNLKTRIADALTPCVMRKLRAIVEDYNHRGNIRNEAPGQRTAAVLADTLSKAVTQAVQGKTPTCVKHFTYTLTNILISLLTAILEDKDNAGKQLKNMTEQQKTTLQDNVKGILIEVLGANPTAPTLSDDQRDRLTQELNTCLSNVE